MENDAPFIKIFNLYDGDAAKFEVFLDINTEEGRVKGTMLTTPEINEKIDCENESGSRKIDNLA